jgi:lipoate-protein ligase A
MPPRQPEYRQARSHQAFVMNLPTSAALLREALVTAWGANEQSDHWPRQRVQSLVAEKYSQHDWNCKL